MIDIRFFHHRQELARVWRQRLDVTPLSLGIDRVEDERRLAGAGNTGNDDKLVVRQAQAYVLEVVNPRTAYFEKLLSQG